jgi:uncharacterized cupin superfamily protein
VAEASLSRGGAGLIPDGDGWFIVNVAEAEGIHTESFGDGVRFEGPAPFPGLGINIRVLRPGQPASMYHRENAAEAFLVLAGECLAIVDGAERQMRKGDLLYSPPGTDHVVVGAGDAPSCVLMAGSRPLDLKVDFPVGEAAARFGASVERETADTREAYRGRVRTEPTSIGLPW